MYKRFYISALAIFVAMASRAGAEEVYVHLALADLELTEGKLPTTDEPNWVSWNRNRDRHAFAVLDGEGEVFVRYSINPRGRRDDTAQDFHRQIAIRVPQAQDVTGRLFLPNWDDKGMQVARFRIPATATQAEARKSFYELKLNHYENLLVRDVPGAAWFRHQSRHAKKALGQVAGEIAQDQPQRQLRGRRRRTGELSETYALFTGGRAMSENLQLDRVLRPDQGGGEMVDLDSIEGITIREIDWKPLIKEARVELDPLAAKIPADQHAIFFPSFNDAVTMVDEIAAQGAPILQLAEPRSTSARSVQRYQQQMCLTISNIARIVGPTVAQSVAVTGSDPYFRTGTDVAVLFEAAEPAALEKLLWAQVVLAAAEHPSAQQISGEVDGLAYRGVRSEDRSICSYIAKTDGLVIVTNSPFQLEQLMRVTNGKTQSLASTDEFAFFRTRYRRGDEGDEDETAFVFLSDATIRRWCGPRWRIATSRRTRDAAVVADIQASQLDRLVQGDVQSGSIYTDLPLAGDSQLTLANDGVHCSTIGSLAFMTPIAEMKIDQVTKAEAAAYRQWRNGYQRNWRWAFDPIGIRLGFHHQKLSGDLTVMPLIWGSEYRQFISVSQGAEFKPDAGDRHDTLAHVILAINTKSPRLQQQTNMFRAMTGTQLEPLGWLGDGVSAYLDEDAFWKEMAAVSSNDNDYGDFMQEQGWRLPLAVRAEVSNGFKLTAFLAVVRGFIEQSSPGMLNWESLTYAEEPYVKISPTERAIGRREEVRNLALYYSASGESLTVTLNEDLLKRSIDRELARRKAEAKGTELPAAERPWLGSNLALQVEHGLLEVLAAMGRVQYQRAMQSRAWGNLAILNEWKRRYPERDPVALHEQFWQDRLLCPGGGEYVWNDQWQTMESTIYGCPAAAKDGPLAAPLLETVERGNFGLTFEEQGLRARVSLDR